MRVNEIVENKSSTWQCISRRNTPTATSFCQIKLILNFRENRKMLTREMFKILVCTH